MCGCMQDVASLMYSLQELPLVLADPGVVDLLHQLGVFVDEPGFPQHVSCCILYLLPDNKHTYTHIVSNRQPLATEAGNRFAQLCSLSLFPSILHCLLAKKKTKPSFSSQRLPSFSLSLPTHTGWLASAFHKQLSPWGDLAMRTNRSLSLTHISLFSRPAYMPHYIVDQLKWAALSWLVGSNSLQHHRSSLKLVIFHLIMTATERKQQWHESLLLNWLSKTNLTLTEETHQRNSLCPDAHLESMAR